LSPTAGRIQRNDSPNYRTIFNLIRTVTAKTGKRYIETVYAVTSLSVTDATPTDVAGWLRGHRSIGRVAPAHRC